MASYVVIMATWVWEEVGYFYMRKLQSGLQISLNKEKITSRAEKVLNYK